MKKNLLDVALVLSIITALVAGTPGASAAPRKADTTAPFSGGAVTMGVGANDWGI